MSEEMIKFWLPLWRTTMLCFLVFVLSCQVSCQMSKYQLRKALEAKVEPMAARCAINSYGTDCVLVMSAEANRK